MEMSRIQSNQVNFKAQAQPTTQTKPAFVEKINNLEDKEKLALALGGLGTIGLAAVLMAKGKRQR